MRHALMKSLIPIFFSTVILTIASNSVNGQSEEKTFTDPKLGFSMKYPSDWSFISAPGEQDPSAGDHVYFVGFCPSPYLESEPNVLSCQSDSPVNLGINLYKLKDGATLQEFYDQQIAGLEDVKDLVGPRKDIEISKINISGLSAIQRISTSGGEDSGSLGKLLAEIGRQPSKSKDIDAYVVNASTGYTISGGTDDEKDFETYLPTIQKMINSFQIQGARENSHNTAFVPDTKTAPTADVVLLSQRMKKGDGDFNDIVGQVKNIGSDTVKFVKIGLTVYDKNGDVVGTDSTYSTATTLEPDQKSSFDMISNKDNFDGMASYELSLQWQDSDGTEQYVDNAQIYKVNGSTQ